MGNYKLAHEQVHHAYCELRGELAKQRSAEAEAPQDGENLPPNAQAPPVGAAEAKAPKVPSSDSVLSELLRLLVVLHSYVLVKTSVKLGDHMGAAR